MHSRRIGSVYQSHLFERFPVIVIHNHIDFAAIPLNQVRVHRVSHPFRAGVVFRRVHVDQPRIDTLPSWPSG
jgi:hypothetical protein